MSEHDKVMGILAMAICRSAYGDPFLGDARCCLAGGADGCCADQVASWLSDAQDRLAKQGYALAVVKIEPTADRPIFQEDGA